LNLEELLEQIKSILIPLAHFWEKLKIYYFELPFEEFSMQLIVITIFILFAFTIILAVTVLILRVKNMIKAYRFRKMESSWEKALIRAVMFGDEADSEEIIVKRRNRFFYVQYLYQFAQRLQGKELEKVQALAEPYLDVVVKGLKGNYPELRARNINILGTFGFPNYIDTMKEALRDKSPIVTMTAARALARPGYPEHCKVILPVLGMFDQWSMNFLSSMLAEMGSEACPDLREAMSNPENSMRVRISCAEALRSIGDLEAANIAVDLLALNEEAEFQAALLRLLKEVGVSRHRTVALALINSPHFIVRAHALSVLGQIGNKEDGELIQAGLEDESSWVVLHAARTLKKLHRNDLLEPASQSEHRMAPLVRQVLSEGVAN